MVLFPPLLSLPKQINVFASRGIDSYLRARDKYEYLLLCTLTTTDRTALLWSSEK